jgi:hypothetical protein
VNPATPIWASPALKKAWYWAVDKIPNGIATSIKSIDLNAATYHKEQSLTYRLQQSVDKVHEFDGADIGGKRIDSDDILGRALQVIIPAASMTDAQRVIFQKPRQSPDEQ